MTATLKLANDNKAEFNLKGLGGVFRKGWQKTRQFMFYSTCSIWYERSLDDPISRFTPGLDLEPGFLAHDKGELIEWLKQHQNRFPWIFSNKEIESALINKHIFFILKHKHSIIGYVKIGVGPTYIHDFDKTVVFEPGAAFIYDTFILPEYRGMNLALFAVNEVARFCKERNFKKMICHIEKWNIPSVKTFKKAGFQAVDSIRFIRVGKLSFYLRNKYRPFFNLEKALRS